MRPASLHAPSFALLLLAVAACQPKTETPGPPPPPSIAGEWTLVELDTRPAPPGADGRPAILGFDPESTRVSGFAGCNRLTAGFTMAGDSLRIEAPALTKMACADGMELEQLLANALTATTRYEITDLGLILLGSSGPVARFTRTTP